MLGGSLEEEEEGDSLCMETNVGTQAGQPGKGVPEPDASGVWGEGGGAVLLLIDEDVGRAGGWFEPVMFM